MNNLLLVAQAETTAGMSGPQYAFGAVYLLVCLAMIGAILMKTPKNDGLGGMMGGGDNNFKGAKSKDDTIDTITNGIAIAFIAMSVGLNYVF